MENNIKTIKHRFAYLDNVRSLVIFLVVVMHSAVTYSGLGGWYYIEGSPENLSIFELIFFAFMQSHMQAWIMGALFFISAYLAAKALARHGLNKFIKERLFRLGLPLLIYIFFITPIIGYLIKFYGPETSFIHNYIKYITSFYWLGGTGPLWYVQVLLIFCAIYVLVKKCFPVFIKIQNIDTLKIIFAIIITGVIAFLIRLIFPIGSSILNLQFSYFASYIVMFIAGILIGENDLLDKVTNNKNIKWLKLSLIIGIPMWVIIMLFGGALEGNYYFEGGLNWQSFSFAIWESLTAIGFSIGIIALFKKKVNIDNEFSGLIRDNAFGIYFFHALIMVTVSLILKNLVFNPLLKFAIVTIISFVLCLSFSFLIRKIKPIGILFK